MANLMRACGFYPGGDEPANVWGLFPPGTTTVAPMRIPPGTLVSTLINGNVENDGTHFYVTLNNARYIISVAKIVTAKGDLLVASGPGSITRLPGNLNEGVYYGKRLKIDNAQALGMYWSDPPPIDVAILAPGSAVTWVDQPAGYTELFGLTIHRLRYDLTEIAQARLVVNVVTPGAANAQLRAQFSPDQNTWDFLSGSYSAGPVVGIYNTGVVVSGWFTLIPEARGDVYLRVVGYDGDGVTDPTFGRISLQFREIHPGN